MQTNRHIKHATELVKWRPPSKETAQENEKREGESYWSFFWDWKFKSHALIRGIALQYTETGGDESGCQTRHSWIRHVKCQGNASNT